MHKNLSHVIGWSLLFVLILGNTHSLLAQTTIFSQSFGTWSNGAPINWSVLGSSPGWLPADSLPAASRPSLSGCDFNGSYLRFPSASLPQPQPSSLISPSLNLSGYPGATLDLEMCIINPGPASGEGDGVEIFFSKDGGNTWVYQGTDTAWYGAWTTVTWSIADTMLSSQFQIRIDGIGYQALLDLGIDRIGIVNPAPPCFAQATTVLANVSDYICKDNQSDSIQISNSGTGPASYDYVVTDALNRILLILPGTTVDLNTFPEDQYRIYGVSYIGALQAPVGQPIQQVSATGCAILSQNHLNIQVVSVTASLTVTSDYNGYQVSAFEARDGTAQVQVNGGSGMYRYLWSSAPSVNQPSIQQLAGGYQWVQVTDSVTGCIWADSFNLSMPPRLEPMLKLLEPIRCVDGSDAVLAAQIVGGVEPYAILWHHDPNEDSLLLTALSAGWYKLTVTDQNGATAVDSVLISNPDSLRLRIQELKHACPGLSDGALILDADGGAGGYSFVWDHGPFGNFLAGLSPDTYRVTLRDENGCSVVTDIDVVRAPDPLVIPGVTDPTCFGDENGSIRLEVIGGRLPMIHNWQQGDTGDVISNLRPGNYQVFSVDGNGCRDTNLVRLNAPAPLRVSVQTTPDGGGATGSALVNVTGGVSPYSARWTTGDTVLSPSNLPFGDHILVVSDANGCTTEEPVSIGLNFYPDCLSTHLGFSPNGDGINDVWELPCLDAYGSHEIQVLNRWGQRVLFSTDYRQNWDGRSRGEHLPSGTYYYVIRLTVEGSRQEFKGTLSIVR